ncbi:alkene reductase [Pseudochrobactrum sp. sp1633]|uniref:alkene reductase n=1 Tax=Pseudochrobactrum sp. sp1633 TaxID=3036706 RepID=UPI0025A66F41|nr:alkene reductase [Pseudochrobactrum sp. sp1633]MDM8344727.1 alkene reductase [Pseudochrobactrum sp. sp1633]HWD13512.1 alkene reductase [Pseudochrobactrum sp.]
MSDLFSSYNLSGLSLENRVVMAPMTRARAVDTVPDSDTALYYAQRAGAGLIVTEGTPISDEGRGYLYTPGVYSAEQVAGWKKVTDAVHARGGKLFSQIWHVGRVSHTSVQKDGIAPVAPVAEIAKNSNVFGLDDGGTPGLVSPSAPRALNTEEIARITKEFADAADNAVKAGFDGVEIHGANGYLIEQFINAGFNTREDAYGGATIAGRIRFALEVVDAVVARIGASRVGIRLTPFSRLFDLHAFEGEEATWLELARELSKRNLAYIHIGNAGGLLTTEEGHKFLTAFRKAYQGTLIYAGGYTQETAQRVLDEGLTDLVAFGKPYIANPDLAERMRNGWPLAASDHTTFYGGAQKGYTDYPAYEAAV